MSREKVNNFVSLGQTIRTLRLSRGMQQKQLAEKSGLTATGLRLIEKGKVTPGRSSLRGIALALGLPADHFFEPDLEPKYQSGYRLVVELDVPQDFPMTDANLRRMMKRRPLHLHNLRDTFIVRALVAGVPAFTVAKICGNSVQVIEKHYAEYGDYELIRAGEILESS